MSAKHFFACVISTGIYFFPIPGVHITQSWGKTLLSVWNNTQSTQVDIALLGIFAVCYQLLFLYFINATLKVRMWKTLLAAVPLVILFYAGLVVGVYIVDFLSVSIDGYLNMRTV